MEHLPQTQNTYTSSAEMRVQLNQILISCAEWWNQRWSGGHTHPFAMPASHSGIPRCSQHGRCNKVPPLPIDINMKAPHWLLLAVATLCIRHTGVVNSLVVNSH